MKPNIIAPPPWNLTGEGMVLLYHVPQDFNQQHGFMQGFQSQGYTAGIGAVILAEYKSSNVGPYFEMLYLPGLLFIGGKVTFSISKIFVSTYESAWNGRENWGIPKELADFTLVKRPNGERLFEAEVNGQQIFKAHVQPWSLQFPFSNKFIPGMRIVQQLQEQLLLTRPVACGHMQMASLKSVTANAAFFPPLHLLKPFATLFIPDFLLSFPKPEVL